MGNCYQRHEYILIWTVHCSYRNLGNFINTARMVQIKNAACIIQPIIEIDDDVITRVLVTSGRGIYQNKGIAVSYNVQLVA